MKSRARKLHSVNVLEMVDDDIQQMISFSDTPAGNAKAEKVFAQMIQDQVGPPEDGGVLDPDTMADFIEDGYWQDTTGYQIFLIHST